MAGSFSHPMREKDDLFTANREQCFSFTCSKSPDGNASWSKYLIKNYFKSNLQISLIFHLTYEFNGSIITYKYLYGVIPYQTRYYTTLSCSLGQLLSLMHDKIY